jgi:hypothetical protein
MPVKHFTFYYTAIFLNRKIKSEKIWEINFASREKISPDAL